MEDDWAQQALAWLDDQREAIVDLAAKLIAAPSITYAGGEGDERSVATILAQRLTDLGLSEVSILAKEEKRPNVVCRLRGTGHGPTLMYNGHIDTKPIGDRSEWHSDPLAPTIRNGKLYGLGASDMKSAIAAMVFSAAALIPLCDELAGDLLLVFNADEEGGSRYGARYLVEECGITADAALIGEPQSIHDPFEYLAVVSRGLCAFNVKVYGTQMHSSISDLVPSVNASAKMAHVLTRMHEDLVLSYPPHPYCRQGATINVGVMVRGGVSWGIYPGLAEFSVEVRTTPGMSLEKVESEVSRFLSELCAEDPELKVTMELAPPPRSWLEPTEIPGEALIVQTVQSAATRVLGRPVPLGAFPGGTDARVYQAMGGIPTVPAFGPGLLPVSHGPNEFVPVESIVQASKIYALAALDYLSRQGKGDSPDDAVA